MGSLHQASITRTVVLHIAEHLRAGGCSVDSLDFEREPLPLYNPDTAHDAPGFDALLTRVERADVYVLGTPDYHGSISSALKNFLDHFWREFAGKLFATIVASHEKGLTVTDQLRTDDLHTQELTAAIQRLADALAPDVERPARRD